MNKDYKNNFDISFELENRILELKNREFELNLKYDFNTKNYIYDPDSSLRAWEYYFKKYDMDLSNDESAFYKYFFEENFKKARGFVKTGKPNAKRIIGVFAIEIKNKNDYKFILKKQSEKTLEYINIGGDCSFNFNDKKIKSFFKKIVTDKNETEYTREKILNILLLCFSMHHSVYNFNLMPTTGGLNNFKGRGHDRLDNYLFQMNNFFEKEEKDLKHPIFKSRGGSKDILLTFLKEKVQSFENYCNIFYHININDGSWDRLIKPQEIKDCKSLLNYIELAVMFWEHQADHYDKCIKKQN